MSAPTDPLDLASDFPAASEDEWRALVAGVLRKSGLADGADPVEALSSSTYDGIDIRPLYTSAPDHTRSYTVRESWDVRALHRDPDAARTNRALLADLETGATSLWLLLSDAGIAVGDLAAALDGVLLDLAPVVLDAGAETVGAAQALASSAGDTQLTGSLGADPIGLQARTGVAADLGVLGTLLDTARPHPGLRIATVDASVYHDAGASDAAEIGVATAVGVAYLRALTDAGLSVEDALARIDFRFAVTADQFASIAKLRAARQVWARVAELCGAADSVQIQHAVTSAAMMTRRDPWVNMLRTTVACFAAAVGGADAVTVLPFDDAIGLPDDFARRIARNTQAILHDESSLGRVSDAAGGSWYVETLTAQLAEKAWDEFTAIERDRGPVASLDAIAARIRTTREQRADDVAHRRAPLTGVSEFALPDEAPLPRTAAPPARAGGQLELARWAAGFESVRDEVEARQPRPAVFLAALGPFSTHSARVGFASNLFNAGGFRVVVGTPEDFADSGAQVACLCSSDTVYGAEGEAAVASLRAAGATRILLAGKVELDGVDGTVFAGCDALEVLRTTLEVSA